MKDAGALKIDRLSRLIVRMARENNLSSGLILSVMKVESGFRGWATSPRGALGLMQLMPETGAWMAQRYGIGWDGPATLLDEEKNTTLGIRYLAYLRDKYSGDLEKALSAYNRGPAKVDGEVSGGKNGTLKYFRKVRYSLPRFALGDIRGRRSNVASIE
ncbi:MAG: lytic transglycosylase domain-containing protein [Deltaproteobacteria bacterium]|nr:lytic transglycosylase domain-containing protein [Deltaproteobacteria bacterium]